MFISVSSRKRHCRFANFIPYRDTEKERETLIIREGKNYYLTPSIVLEPDRLAIN